jgi:thioredoxin-related protein
MKKYSKSILCRLSVCLFLLSGGTANAQQVADDGIHFENNLTWKDILAKAAKQHKYIFVDCYATWCGPCKKMDQDVYTKELIGKFIDQHFISVKIQFDTSRKDNDAVKKLYADAHWLMTTYSVHAFPTYLFFDDHGEILHRGIGYKPANAFINLGEEALDPKRQFYTQLTLYKSGHLDKEFVPSLAQSAKELELQPLAVEIAVRYNREVLDQLNDKEFLTKKNLDFLAGFASAMTSKDKIFQLALSKPALLDSVKHDRSLSGLWIDAIINKEEIAPEVKRSTKQHKEPNWTKISASITAKYGMSLARANVIAAKMHWYKDQKNPDSYSKYLALYVDEAEKRREIPDDYRGPVFYNSMAWQLFLYDRNRTDLEKALGWLVRLDQQSPVPAAYRIDTEACILYKLGRTAEAIATEEKAISIDPKDQQNKDFAETLQKMKNGERTWPDKMD